MTQAQLTVHHDGAWFRVHEQQSIDLRNRAKYRVLLKLLVREHLRDPQASVGIGVVIRELWPNAQVRHAVARNRAYVALCSLRKWGLEGILLRTPQGYQLDPQVALDVVDLPVEEGALPARSVYPSANGSSRPPSQLDDTGLSARSLEGGMELNTQDDVMPGCLLDSEPSRPLMTRLVG